MLLFTSYKSIHAPTYAYSFASAPGAIKNLALVKVFALARKTVPVGQEGRARLLFSIMGGKRNGFISSRELFDFTQELELNISEVHVNTVAEMISR